MKTIFGRTEVNWYLKTLKQDQKVEFDDSINKGTGVICGIASSGIPIGGVSYIVKLDNTIPDFDYTHIAILEIFLNPIV